MSEFLWGIYDWVKVIHVISVISWMAGLLYLPRLFVYHVEKVDSESMDQTFCLMEFRLFKYIMNPAMMSSWLFGLVLLATPGTSGLPEAYWFYPKFAGIIGLTWVHMWLGKRRKDFAAGANTRTSRTYRMMNEVPTLCMVVIVAMVIAKPF